MVAVIPAKEKSSRVPNKNWRPFFGSKCLVEIKIEQLLDVLPAKDIYLSCDDASKKEISDKYGINFLLRNSILASDNTSWSEVVTGIISQVPVEADEEILWAEATSPLFQNYKNFIEIWFAKKNQHDSIAAVNEFREFLMNANGKPLNFKFGKEHCPSQELEPMYSMDSFFIMTKYNMLHLNYMIGNQPYLYIIPEKSIEIDTMSEFMLAQKIYEEQVNE